MPHSVTRTSIALLLGVVFCVSAGAATAPAAPPDTLIPGGVAYSGYRLHIRNVELIKERRGVYQLEVEVINTGRRPIALGPGFPVRYLQTTFDESLERAGLLALAMPLRDALVDSRLSFKIGEWKRGLEFKVKPGTVVERPDLAVDTFEQTRQRYGARKRTALAADSSDRECVDLSFAQVIFSERGHSDATLSLSIRNEGQRALTTDELPEGFGLTIYLNGSPTVTSSARRVAQVDLRGKLEAAGVEAIEPGAYVTVTQIADTQAATRYTAVLIAQIDSGQVLPECDETNNEGHVVLTF